MTLAAVKLWGKTIGAVRWDATSRLAFFEYEKPFLQSNVQPSPVTMPLSTRIYFFPALNRETFQGLPGLLADSLPDKFGNAVIDAWLVRNGRRPEDFNPVERLCYVGSRGMGALEYEPAMDSSLHHSDTLEVSALVELASDILAKRKRLNTKLQKNQEKAFQDILRVGASAGGARAKALIAWNTKTGEIRSGQVTAPSGFDYWLLKFDGVSGNKDKELDDPAGYGKIEYAYYKMALAAGITMSECRLLHENGRSHFVTRRFDRDDMVRKLHMQTLGAMAHFDYNQPGVYSYEQAFQIIRRLGLSMSEVEEQFRRMAFNMIARNQDDHVKNISFLMDKSGNWSLSPAYDINYSYNPSGAWTRNHQMSMNGKRDGFVLDDFKSCEKFVSMKRGRGIAIAREVSQAVRSWPKFAGEAGVPGDVIRKIGKSHRILTSS